MEYLHSELSFTILSFYFRYLQVLMPRQWQKNREEPGRGESDITCITSNIFDKDLEKFAKFRFEVPVYHILCVLDIYSVLHSYLIFAYAKCNRNVIPR